MKKLILLTGLIAILIVIGYVKVAKAIPPPLSPACFIKGIIEDVKCYKNKGVPCVEEEKAVSDIYHLTIKIEEVSYISGDTTIWTCEGTFPLNSSQEVYIYESSKKPEDIFQINDIIKGNIGQAYTKEFNSYVLEKASIQNGEETISQSEKQQLIEELKKRIIELQQQIIELLQEFIKIIQEELKRKVSL